jgi:nardilysin
VEEKLTCLFNYFQLKSIEDLDIPKFMSIMSSTLSKIGVEGLFHGNVDKSDGKFAQEEILRLLEASGGGDAGLARKKYPKQLVMQVPISNQTLRCAAKDPMDPNRAVEIYFQVGKDNTFERVMADLLMEMMYEPLFDQLRTKDQFGYQVSCDTRWTDGVIGMQIQVVSSTKSVEEVDARIEEFLTDFRQTLADMSQDDFLAHMAALANYKLHMFNSMSDETGHYWSEIRDGRYLFQVEREEVLCLKGIEKSQALEAYDKWLYPAGTSKRRRLSVQVIGCEILSSEVPNLDQDGIENYNDKCVKEFHKSCKNQTFGKIY